MSLINGQYIEEHQITGRMVKNALGVDEVVTMPNTHWKHFDWLVSHGIDMDKFTAEVDVHRHSYNGYDISFSTYLTMQMVRDEQARHRAGEPVPLHINPHRIVD